MVVPVNVVPPSDDGFYAINNQFLANGPKGFMEFKTLENEDTFVRMDLPGVPKEGVVVSLDQSKKSVCIFAVAPREHKHDFSPRIYGITTLEPKLSIDGTKTELVCKCHEISGFTSLMSDGVLRLILTKTHTATQGPCFSFFDGSGSHASLPGTDPNDGFYAINNQFLANGPKGFMEFKTLENEDTFIRVDLPGVPKDGVVLSLDQSKKAICISAVAPVEHKHDFSHRIYDVVFRPKVIMDGIKSVCKCHEITGFTSLMSDGVLRLTFTKTHIAIQGTCATFFDGSGSHASLPGTDPNDPRLSGRVLMPHPCVNEGSQMAYESKMLQDGKLYVRVDMPGVPKDNFTVSVTNGRVKVTGEAPALSHDSSGRFYSGDVAMLSTPVDIPVRRIKIIAKNGVIRLIIPPV